MGAEFVDSKSPLSVSVLTLVPTAGSFLLASIGDSGGDSKTVQRTAVYDGSSVWEAYRTQFDLLGGLNGGLNEWKESEKAAHLAISL